MNTNQKSRSLSGRRRAFTLIELLVVVAIILILAGIALKVMSMVNNKTARTATIRTLEQVRNALAAFYAANGVYPPVAGVSYEYENTPASSLPAVPPDGMGYTTGLCYYIFHDGTSHFNTDVACRNWQHYLTGLNSDYAPVRSNAVPFGVVAWTNSFRTIRDAWDNEIQYECWSNSAFQTYVLRSTGGPGGPPIEVTSAE